MDTLDRFLIREFLIYFFWGLLGLAFLYLGIDFLSRFWMLRIPMAKIIELYGYKIPGALQQFVPVACLMAALLVLSTMSKQNEVLALYASGVGTLRLVSTFIAVVATISTVSFLVFDTFVPLFAKRQMLVERGLDPSQENVHFGQEGRFWYRSGRLFYNVGRFVPESNTLEDLNAYLLTPSFRLSERIHAKKAVFRNNDWTLMDGVIIRYPRENPFPVGETFEQRRGVIPEKPGDFKTFKVDEAFMRLRDLRTFIAKNSAFGMDTTSQKVHYHERLALVFTPLVFVLLGIPFALRPLKTQSAPKSIAFCFLIVFLYLLMFRMSLSIGKGGHIPPAVAGWAPNAIFFAIACLLISRRS